MIPAFLRSVLVVIVALALWKYLIEPNLTPMLSSSLPAVAK